MISERYRDDPDRQFERTMTMLEEERERERYHELAVRHAPQPRGGPEDRADEA